MWQTCSPKRHQEFAVDLSRFFGRVSLDIHTEISEAEKKIVYWSGDYPESEEETGPPSTVSGKKTV